MSVFETLFGSLLLTLSVPDTSFTFPTNSTADEWLSQLSTGQFERKQAFFDEQLQALLTAQISHPSIDEPVDVDNPPRELLAFLAHLQITLEATYISPYPVTTSLPETSKTTLLSAPPKGGSSSKLSPRSGTHHPSIFPPNTPNPTPSTAERDKKYVQSEGTLLVTSTWGQNNAHNDAEAFHLMWSKAEQMWVAVYRLAVAISFIRLKFSDPLLCLTVSATLREKPLTLTQPNHPLAEFFASKGALSFSPHADSPAPNGSAESALNDDFNALEEVNLLQGLFSGPTLGTPDLEPASSAPLELPSTRLGVVTRRKLFALPPASLPSPNVASPSLTALRTPHPTLRKSFRRTLGTASGFRVRMRTVFVPCVMLDDTVENKSVSPPDGIGDTNVNDASAALPLDGEPVYDEEKERREAGSEERTVVLCVEIENSGESGEDVAFEVEKVDVMIGGEGAKIKIIGWGDSKSEEHMFPLHIGAMAQYNLLYAVSFSKSPEDVDSFLLSRDLSLMGAQNTELRRAVTIVIYGKPAVVTQSTRPDDGARNVVYPTNTFSSRWNCILDLSASSQQDMLKMNVNTSTPLSGADKRTKEVLPEPPSPFPTPNTHRSSGAFSTTSGGSSTPPPVPTSVAGTFKRHTLPGGGSLPRSIKTSMTGPWRASTSMLNPSYQSLREKASQENTGNNSASNRLSYIPPSIAAASQVLKSPTTYNFPQGYGGIQGEEMQGPGVARDLPPPTPAYPSYPSPSGLPPPPQSQGPITSHNSGPAGQSIEVKRDRGSEQIFSLPMSGGVPATPLPTVPGGVFCEQGMQQQLRNAEERGSAIVVSVGLLSPTRTRAGGSGRLNRNGRIFPFDTFTLDIFVFNKSGWTRRLEISCPDKRTRRKNIVMDGRSELQYADEVGVLPLENRIRIGPLRPAACQSIHMDFLAVTPGVHSIDTLTLTDVESGTSMNLRSVMDIVVHENVS